MKRAKRDELVDGIERYSNQHDFTDRPEAVPEVLPATLEIGADRPQIRWPALMCILDAVAYAEKQSHRRLKYETEMQRAIQTSDQAFVEVNGASMALPHIRGIQTETIPHDFVMALAGRILLPACLLPGLIFL